MSNDERALTIPEAASLALAGGSMAQMLASMSNEEFDGRLAALERSRERMAQIQLKLMKQGIDYGLIPGTGDKPTLLKPGSETLLQFYQLVPTFESTLERGDGSTSPHIRYHVRCALHVASADGPIVGWGEGAANSSEKKYRYRTAERACPECGSLKTIIKGKPEYEKDPKFRGGFICFEKKGGCGAKFTADDPRIIRQQLGMVENPDPDDVDNTLLKMAEKRAQIDATLRTTATSGLFTQDVEDMDLGGQTTTPPAPAPTQQNGVGNQSRSSATSSTKSPETETGTQPGNKGDDFVGWFRAKAKETDNSDILPLEFAERARKVRDAVMETGLDTKQMTTAMKSLTNKSVIGDVSAAELRLLESIVAAGKVGAIKAIAEALSK